jgi:hypothetical protein
MNNLRSLNKGGRSESRRPRHSPKRLRVSRDQDHNLSDGPYWMVQAVRSDNAR